MTPQALAQFRSAFPDCDLVLFADIGSGTVLASNARLSFPQEVLDGLCLCAQGALSIRQYEGDGLVDRAVFATPGGARLFLRAPSGVDEALCCLCGPEVDLDALIEAALTAMQDPRAPQ